jgi:hypothetical protein
MTIRCDSPLYVWSLRPDGPLASPGDFAVPICCETWPEVLGVLHRNYSRWKANQEVTS